MNLKIEDIAKKAGVSKTAVSFALNNKPGISDETRDRILNIVRDYGYAPKVLIKSSEPASDPRAVLLLTCSRTEITSVDFGTTPFYTELIRSIEKRVNELGYDLWLRSINIDREFREQVSQLFRSRNASGVLLIATDMLAEDVEIVQSINKNVVALDSFFDFLNVDCIVMDNFQGAYSAAEYLVKLGHKNIGYVQSRHRIHNFDMRKAGFESALRRRGVEPGALKVYSVVPTIEATASELRPMLENCKELPTAIFAENDYMAIGTVKCLQNMGIKIPEDVSVIGFDNIELSSLITPELTTLDVPKERMAFLAVEKLIYNIENNSGYRSKDILAVNLIERNSCKEA